MTKFINESDIGLSECALNSGIPEMEENLFQYGKSGKPSYDTAFAMYSYLYAFGLKPSDELTTYIRRVGKKIAEYMIESNRTQDAIRLIGFNILTSNALKSLHESAIQQKRVDIVAYLMEAIKKNERVIRCDCNFVAAPSALHFFVSKIRHIVCISKKRKENVVC